MLPGAGHFFFTAQVVLYHPYGNVIFECNKLEVWLKSLRLHVLKLVGVDKVCSTTWHYRSTSYFSLSSHQYLTAHSATVVSYIVAHMITYKSICKHAKIVTLAAI